MNKINGNRLWKNLHDLADISEKDQPWTRRSFTAKYNEGRQWLKQQMETTGLEVRVDEAANMIGEWVGTEPDLPPIVIGSHTDTVPSGGRFDGIAGVLTGLEVIRVIKEQDIHLRNTIQLVDFTAEEPSAYGLSTVGSRAWSGNLSEEMLQYQNEEGETLADAIRFAGGNPIQIKQCKKKADAIALYLELHIEQGPVLLHEKAHLGVVSGIVGIQRFKINVNGMPNHAGTTPMNMRKDALVAASEIVLVLEREANETYDYPVVGTVGILDNYPNASNVVPGEVVLELEIRSISEDVIDKVSSHLKEKINHISIERDIEITVEDVSRSAPIIVEEKVSEILHHACEEVVDKVITLPSGAGHDANQMSLLGPTGMIFIPCKDGRSHCPEEWAEKDDLTVGASAMLQALLAWK
jgi:N-carbamoyl-L-amino-acid hydrolase